MFKKRNYRKRVSKKTKRVAGGKRGFVSAGVKKYVKRAIDLEVEDKSVQINQQISFGSISESPDMNAFPMCPKDNYWVLGLGSGAGSRLGNRVKIKSVHLNYVLRPNPYGEFNLAPVPCNVLLYLGYVKNAPSYVPVSADFSQFFQGGNSVYAPSGTLKDSIAVINKDYWVIKKRWMEKIGYAFNDGTGAIPGNQYFANNDYKMNAVRKIDITKYCQKTCVFNDSVNNGQTNRNLFFMYEAVSSTGFNTGATTLTCNIDYWIDFTYQDA